MPEEISVTEIIHGLARVGRKARAKRRSWTGSDEHRYYLDGRTTALETQAALLAFEYAHTDACDWLPSGHPDA